MWTLRSTGPLAMLAQWWRTPGEWACAQAGHQIRWQQSGLQWLLHPGPHTAQRLQRTLVEGVGSLLAWPFDLWRAQHAAAAAGGLWQRSMLESQRFEQQLGRLETVALGPLARSR